MNKFFIAHVKTKALES